MGGEDQDKDRGEEEEWGECPHHMGECDGGVLEPGKVVEYWWRKIGEVWEFGELM